MGHCRFQLAAKRREKTTASSHVCRRHLRRAKSKRPSAKSCLLTSISSFRLSLFPSPLKDLCPPSSMDLLKFEKGRSNSWLRFLPSLLNDISTLTRRTCSTIDIASFFNCHFGIFLFFFLTCKILRTSRTKVKALETRED